MATITTTQQLCDKCGAAPAQVICVTRVGEFVFCMHDYKKQIRANKFKGILITCAPIRSDVTA